MKRLSIDRDWIMRATDDVACREAMFASAAPALPPEVRTPTLGAASDGEGYAILMRDITPALLPQGDVAESRVALILDRMAALHRAAPPEGVAWCDTRLRLTLLVPERARITEAYGAPVAGDLIAGWRLFAKHASPLARGIIDALIADTAPLLSALSVLPSCFLHGDLKFDNIGIDEDDGLQLIDWAMPLVAPAAVDLGWFLAINSRRTTLTLDAMLSRYASSAGIAEHRARHDALTAVCGLLLRGWRKALDAEEGEPDELRWWCERVEAAESLLR